MILHGKAYKFGDDVNTDYIIAGKYRSKGLDMKLLSKHLMEDLYPNFTDTIKTGDFIVAGKNFGCGSSREYAPKVIVEAGIGAVFAKSYARIFYRNAINSGLLVIECNTDLLDDGDVLEVDTAAGVMHDKTQECVIPYNPIPEFISEIINAGGVISYLNENGDFKIK